MTMLAIAARAITPPDLHSYVSGRTYRTDPFMGFMGGVDLRRRAYNSINMRKSHPIFLNL